MATQRFTRSKATKKREFSAQMKGLKPVQTVIKIPERKAVVDTESFYIENDFETDVVSIKTFLYFTFVDLDIIVAFTCGYAYEKKTKRCPQLKLH